jgi:hypothetical protein
MRYKVKTINLKKLKSYINADTKTKSQREAKRIYDEMCGEYRKGV